MANSHPFVALQNSLPNGCSSEELQCIQRKWFSSSPRVAGDLKEVFQGLWTSVGQCLNTVSVLDLWFIVCIFMRCVRNRCSFGKITPSLDSNFFSFVDVFGIKAYSALPKILFGRALALCPLLAVK